MIKFYFIKSKKARDYHFCYSPTMTKYTAMPSSIAFGKLGYRNYKRIVVNSNQAISLDKYMQPGMKEIIICHFYTQLGFFSFKN